MTLPNTFVNGTVADAGSVNENFTYVNSKFFGATNATADTASLINVSGINFSVVGGSILISGGTTYFHNYLDITASVQKHTTAAAGFEAHFNLSGVDINVDTGNILSATSQNYGVLNMREIMTSGIFTGSGGNVGSPFVIFRMLKTAVDDSTVSLASNMVVTGY